MKFIAFLLAVYIFSLNITPCADSVAADYSATTEISQAISNDHQHQGSDSCSPFCICQCCQTTATYSQFEYGSIAIATISTKDFLNLSGVEKDFNTSILQPPRA